MTTLYDREGKLVNLYFDITAGNCFDDLENPCFRDMYLDIVASNGHLEILDQKELDEALEQHDITREEYDHTQQVCEELYGYLRKNPECVVRWCEKAHQELLTAIQGN